MPWAQTGDVQTYYEDSGSGKAIVFLHGLGLDHRLWLPQTTALDDEFRCVTVDWRWHGQTGSTDSADHSVSLLVDDLRALIDELELETPILCAHSIGGLIAAEYAIRYPDDVGGIVFTESRPDLGETLPERTFLKIQPVLNGVAGVIGDYAANKVLLPILRLADVDGFGEDNEVDELGMKRSEYVEDAGDAISFSDKRALQRMGLEYDGLAVTAFDCPVLFSYGKLGAGVIGGRGDRLRRAPTDVRVQEVADASHMLPIQKPEEFNARLRKFVAEIDED